MLSASGMAVFDTMRHIRPDVSTICVGLAASMGAFLLASGHKVSNAIFHPQIQLMHSGQLSLPALFLGF